MSHDPTRPTTTAPAVTPDDIRSARERVAEVVVRTPLQPNVRLSTQHGLDVRLKREDLQPVRSYKLRGAFNLIAQLTPEQRAAGVVCASAGNHGQGVAYACARLGIQAKIVVPTTTPRQKRDRMTTLGGEFVELVVTGDTYDEAARAAAELVAATGATLVPAFDDPRTIAGQGTLAAEIVEQLDDAPDVLLVPVGGGGMLAGCVTWFAAQHPQTRIVAVEPEGAACLGAAMAAGEPVTLEGIETFTDGAAVARIGEHTFPIVRGVEHVTVPEGRICSEMLALYQVDGIIAEPAGALASAALGLVDIPAGASVVAILSGGNNDVSRYSEIVERALVHEGRKHYFLVTFPQEPGALRRFLDEVLGPDDDITLFEYVKRSNRETGPALVGVELGRPGDLPGLLRRMEEGPMRVEKIDPTSPLYRFLV